MGARPPAAAVGRLCNAAVPTPSSGSCRKACPSWVPGGKCLFARASLSPRSLPWLARPKKKKEKRKERKETVRKLFYPRSYEIFISSLHKHVLRHQAHNLLLSISNRSKCFLLCSWSSFPVKWILWLWVCPLELHSTTVISLPPDSTSNIWK